MFGLVRIPLGFNISSEIWVMFSRNHAVEFLGSAAASAAVRCASHRTRRRGKALNGGSFLSVSVSREGASHCPRGGRAPHFQLHGSGLGHVAAFYEAENLLRRALR